MELAIQGIQFPVMIAMEAVVISRNAHNKKYGAGLARAEIQTDMRLRHYRLSVNAFYLGAKCQWKLQRQHH